MAAASSSTRFEIDFFGSRHRRPAHQQHATRPVLRHAYVQWGNWLVGQTWSNFMDVATLPEAVDFIGPTDGTTFVRQPQVRYTMGGFSLSAENRETTILPYDVAGVAGARISPTTAMLRTSPRGMRGRATGATSPWPACCGELTHETRAPPIDDSTGLASSASPASS